MDTSRGLQRNFHVCTTLFFMLLLDSPLCLCDPQTTMTTWSHFLSGIGLKLNRQAFAFKMKNNLTEWENTIVLLEPGSVTDQDYKPWLSETEGTLLISERFIRITTKKKPKNRFYSKHHFSLKAFLFSGYPNGLLDRAFHCDPQLLGFTYTT